jgi:hypothetical protein
MTPWRSTLTAILLLIFAVFAIFSVRRIPARVANGKVPPGMALCVLISPLSRLMPIIYYRRRTLGVRKLAIFEAVPHAPGGAPDDA